MKARFAVRLGVLVWEGFLVIGFGVLVWPGIVLGFGVLMKPQRVWKL